MSKISLQELSLENLCNGAASDLFNRELANVLENIKDPNTAEKVKRKITLEIELTPNDERDFASLILSCNSKLAPVKNVTAGIIIAGEGKNVAAYARETPVEDVIGNMVRDVSFGK